MSIEESAEPVREKLDVEEEDLEEIDDALLVKVYNKSFDRGYQQGFKEKGMISNLKFRFRDHLPAKIYRRIRYIRRIGVLNTLKFKLGLSTPQKEFVMEEDQ